MITIALIMLIITSNLYLFSTVNTQDLQRTVGVDYYQTRVIHVIIKRTFLVIFLKN